ncbi:MAG: M24 family metallopeptidase [bacterium]
MGLREEMAEKEGRVRGFLRHERLDGVLLTKYSNFAWMTCGRSNYVTIVVEGGVASLLITRNKKYLITSNIEELRMREEEIAEQNYEVVAYPWYDDSGAERILDELTRGLNIASDIPSPKFRPLGSNWNALRYSLTPEEVERYRWLGAKVAECAEGVCREVERGMTEWDVDAELSRRLLGHGIVPTLLMVAADERIEKYRHPIATNKRIDRAMMLVVGARKYGLIISLTRLVHFGELPKELRAKHDAVVKVDGVAIAGSRPGVVAKDLFKRIQDAYDEQGYPGEWKLHHQGGPTGYEARDYKATPTCNERLLVNQACAWNPSITGTKSEDTIIIGEDKTEIISATTRWPKLRVNVDGQSIERPDILVK